jgi:hypothetical protein
LFFLANPKIHSKFNSSLKKNQSTVITDAFNGPSFSDMNIVDQSNHYSHNSINMENDKNLLYKTLENQYDIINFEYYTFQTIEIEVFSVNRNIITYYLIF